MAERRRGDWASARSVGAWSLECTVHGGTVSSRGRATEKVRLRQSSSLDRRGSSEHARNSLEPASCLSLRTRRHVCVGTGKGRRLAQSLKRCPGKVESIYRDTAVSWLGAGLKQLSCVAD
eukprot:2468247-Prymnesium_polylepis.2